ncbi:4-aminobutyrate transaminase [Hypoxylon texense]
MPRLRNARSRRQEEEEERDLISEDDESGIAEPMEITATSTTAFEPPKENRPSPRSSPASSRPSSPLINNPGLDWEWVKTLDQDPRGKDYFPPQFDPPEDYQTNGLDIEKPDLNFTGDLREYSIWVLARIRRMRVSNNVASMLSDPNLKIKWVISVNTYWKNSICRYREISLGATGPNHEAAYAAMCGTPLPRESWCEICKANRSAFTYCIVLPGYLTGACVGCHLNHCGSRCSHRPDAKGRVRPTAIPLGGRAQPKKPPTASSSNVQSLVQRQRSPGDTPKAILEDIKQLMHSVMVRVGELERKLD